VTKRGSTDHVVHHVRLGDAKLEEALEHYRQAGEGLRQLKALCRDTGRGFRTYIGVSTAGGKVHFTYQRARHLMKLANEWPVDWDRWQEICGNKKPQPPGVPQGRPNADQKANWG
jgi:hypothetical protein